jgi:hypothetical protein
MGLKADKPRANPTPKAVRQSKSIKTAIAKRQAPLGSSGKRWTTITPPTQTNGYKVFRIATRYQNRSVKRSARLPANG